MTRGIRIVVAVLAALVLYQVFAALMSDGRAAFAAITSGVLVWFITALARRPDDRS